MAKFGFRGKIIASLLAIVTVLFVACFISVIEFMRLSTYVSDLIADNISNINVTRQLAEAANSYNLEILSVIGDENKNELPNFDVNTFMASCDSLNSSLSSKGIQSVADSVKYSFSAYMIVSRELPRVLKNDFVDTRSWYFKRLQPRYKRLLSDIDQMNSLVYTDLKSNAVDYDSSFYRSIIPSIVAVGVGILLVLMLMFYLVVYYANPLGKMLSSMRSYRSFGKKYNYTFEGDDQLAQLNNDIAELTKENQQLRKRISDLRNETGKGKTPLK